MRKINKGPQPQALTDVQERISERLFNYKQDFNWKTKHYNKPVKEELTALYHNKCGFCQSELTTNKTQEEFTIDHFRPQDKYYWLGNEWTNLFPACQGCNGTAKGNDFPLLVESNRIQEANAPFNSDGLLIREKCKADCPELLQEQALFLHPEIEDPQRYFVFEPTGKAVINGAITDLFEKRKAETMLAYFLSRPSVEEKRKRKVLEYQNSLRDCLVDILPEIQNGVSENRLKDLFTYFFGDLNRQQQPNAEFSAMGKFMNDDFKSFFIEPMTAKFGDEIGALLQTAHSLCTENR